MIETLYYSELYWLYLSAVGFITGVVCAIGGSGGLIITPFMIASGMPIHLAIGTAKFSSLGMWGAALLKFKKEDKVKWHFIPKLTIIACIGAIIGSSLTLSLDKESIYPIVGLILVLIAPIGFLRKDFGLINLQHSQNRNKIGYLLYFFVMVFGGFFGAGAGTLAILTLVSCMGLTMFQAHATEIVPWITLTVISSAIFAWYGQVDYALSIALFVSMTLGGWFGAHIAVKGNDKLVKLFTFSFSLLVGLKLLYESL